MMVASMGLSSHPASDGQQAVDTFRSNPSGFSLVIMDVEMPHLDGVAATRKIREINPSAKVVLISGHTKENIWQVRPDAFLLKPFLHIELREVVRSHLNLKMGTHETQSRDQLEGWET